MAGLRTYQEEFKKLIFPGKTATTKSALWGKTLPDRLKVYRNNTRTNWMETLDSDFSLTRSQFTAEDWQTLQQDYFGEHPPRHWELNTSMMPFVKFIAGLKKVKGYVQELADYEWHDLNIFIDRSTVKKGCGTSNPTAVTRVYQHQIFDWVVQQAPKDRPPQQKPEVLVFYRDFKNTCHIREADPLMLLALEHFRKPGARLADLEPVRQKLLPQNTVALEAVVDRLKELGLLLL